jgi:hypothetical protein
VPSTATSRYPGGHVLLPRWIGLPEGDGQHFSAGYGTLCVLGYYHVIVLCGGLSSTRAR